jgi:hypothetical protein
MIKLIKQKIDNFTRTTIVKLFSQKLSLIIINEFPKSGGTWLGNMLSDALSISFPRNRFPEFNESIVHGHYLYSNRMKKVVVIWRDGRDVTLSWYYHCLFKNDLYNSNVVNIVSKHLKINDINDVKTNLPKFIKYSFEEQKIPKFSWAEFVRQWYQKKGVIFTSYEMLLKNTEKELQRIVYELNGKLIDYKTAKKITQKFSFSKQAMRDPGKEMPNRFLRKGIAGDWKNYFSTESCLLFEKFAGKELILLGYEKDNSWVDKGL